MKNILTLCITCFILSGCADKQEKVVCSEPKFISDNSKVINRVPVKIVVPTVVKPKVVITCKVPKDMTGFRPTVELYNCYLKYKNYYDNSVE